MIKHRNKPVLADKEPWMQQNGLNNFLTIVSEVSSFVGNPVDNKDCKQSSVFLNTQSYCALKQYFLSCKQSLSLVPYIPDASKLFNILSVLCTVYTQKCLLR